MKTDYKLGDKVTIVTNLAKTHWRYDFIPERYLTYIHEGMLYYRGKTVTISAICKFDDNCYYMHILEDAGLYRWTWELFEESYEGEDD